MYKVLIADDEPFILEGLADLLKNSQNDLEIVGLAYTGLDALKIIESSTVHILITDIKMPKMNGLELIKHIKNSKKNIKCIVLSGYNDFNYVKEAAILGIENYLLKPIDEKELLHTIINSIHKIENEMNSTMEATEGVRVLKENILLRWASGTIRDSELREKSDFLGINLRSGEFMIALAKIKDDQVNVTYDRGHLMFEANNICNQLVSELKMGITFCDLLGNIVIILSAAKLDSERQSISNLLQECIKSISTALNVNTFISVGNIETDYRTLYKSYNTALNLQNFSLIPGENKIIYNSDLTESFDEIRFDMQSILYRLEYSIKHNRISDIDIIIDDLFKQIMSIPNFSQAVFQNVTLIVIFDIITTIKNLNSKTKDVLSNFKDPFTSIQNCKNIIDLKEWLKDTIIACIKILNEEDEKVNPQIKKILSYINNNYNSNINLTLVADEFNINAFYLGQIFKKETGDTFNLFLNKIRVQKAKELLLNTKYKVSDVASLTGYANINYFFTIFKKITGMSPSEFRDEI